MKQRRWMKAVLAEAKKSETPLPWARKDRPKRAATSKPAPIKAAS